MKTYCLELALLTMSFCCTTLVDAEVITKLEEPETITSVKLITEDWYSYDPVSVKSRKGTVLDMSYLLDAPAGKYGAVIRKGDTLVFKDSGKRIRFWGTNLVGPANFPTKEVAEDYAEGIAQLGYNMVRLHHLDAFWSEPNVFGQKFPTQTRSLDAEALDKLDYLVSVLKEKGIYFYLDLLVSRKPTTLDGLSENILDDIEPGMKVEGLFVPQLIELQKEYIKQLLTHKNPYTGLRYIDDPAVVFHEINNENSLFKIKALKEESVSSYRAISSATYRSLWKELFNQWLLKKYPTRAELSEAWAEDGKKGLQESEDPAVGTVEPAYYTSNWKKSVYAETWSMARQRSFWQFVYDTQSNYYKEVESYIRSLGSTALVTGGNRWYGDVPADLLIDTDKDFFDIHSYWAHPFGGFKYVKGTRVSLEEPLKPALRSNIGDISSKHVSGVPIVISEWNISAPHPYKSVMVPLMASFASLKGWNPIHFAYAHTGNPQEMVQQVLDAYNQPDMQALMSISALLFHRGDIVEAEETTAIVYSNDEVYNPSQMLKRSTWDSLRGKATVRFNEEPPPEKIRNPKKTTTANEDITWDTYEQIVHINTKGIKGILGKLPSSSDEIFDISTAYGVVLIASLTDEPIESSSKILITAVAQTRPTDMLLAPVVLYGNDGVKIVSPGRLPLLVEAVQGTINLVTQKELKCVVLNSSGQVKDAHPIEKNKKGYIIPLNADTMHYLLTVKQ